MYKHVDFTQLEGLPLTQNTLKFLQESYRDAFAGLAAFAGDYVILSGVADLGANWGDGWVAINGEILPFVGGTKAAQIVIEETVVAKLFADGNSRNAWYTRVAKSGVIGGVDHTSFTRMSTLKTLQTRSLYDTIQFIVDGGGIVIGTGEKGHIEVPFNCTITGWTIYADAVGDIVVDIWKDTYANFPPTVADTITAAAKPTLAAARKNQNTTVTGWTTALTKGDILAYKVDSVATVQRVTIVLQVTKLP